MLLSDPNERQLIAPLDPAPRQQYSPLPFSDLEMERDRLPFSQYLWSLKRHRFKILAFIVASVAATFIVSSRITPIYESTATMELDRQVPPGVIGQEANRSAYNDADQFLATQIKILQGDSVLRPVALKFNLLEKEKQIQSAFGSEPPALPDAPILLKRLKITRPPNTYLLQISYRSPDRMLAANVANAIMDSYLEHTFQSRLQYSHNLSNFMERQLDELRAKMEKSSTAQARFERELGVINPEEKTNILSARLLQLNTEFTSAQADRVRKEAAYNSTKGGTMPAARASTQGEALKSLTERLNEAEEKFAEVKSHFGSNHPEYRKQEALVAEFRRQLDATKDDVMERTAVEYDQAVNRENMLKRAVATIKTESDKLNERSFQYQALHRQAEADKKLYDDLERRIQEAGINSNFQNNATHIDDLARPGEKPVFPNTPLNLILSFLLSTLLATGLAIIHDVTDDTLHDPDQIASIFKTSVVGALPARREWRKGLLASPSNGNGNGHKNGVSILKKPANTFQFSRYDEAVRIMRSSILLTNMERQVKSLLITSALPGEGKTTTAVQFAVAHAEQDRKTLIVDADLRRPSVHKTLGIPVSPGIADVLERKKSWRDVLVIDEERPTLHILPAGVPSGRSCELIGHWLPQLLADAANDYDLIIVDSPPLLGFAEPLQMATAVDGVLVVAWAGKTSRNAIASVLNTLARLRANIVGIVLNQVTSQQGVGYYQYAEHYHYDRVAS